MVLWHDSCSPCLLSRLPRNRYPSTFSAREDLPGLSGDAANSAAETRQVLMERHDFY